MPRSDSHKPLRLALGEALRFIRNEKGLTQADLGERTGFHPTQISHLERGGLNPTLVTLRRLSEALGIETWELVARVEEFERSMAAKTAKGRGSP